MVTAMVRPPPRAKGVVVEMAKRVLETVLGLEGVVYCVHYGEERRRPGDGMPTGVRIKGEGENSVQINLHTLK
jgi:hypothetical protein